MSNKIDKFLYEAGEIIDKANNIRDIQNHIEALKENNRLILDDSYINDLEIGKTKSGLKRFYVDDTLSGILIQQYISYNKQKIEELENKLKEIEETL